MEAEEVQIVVFKIGDQEYGVKISDVQEIVRMLPIVPAPNVPPCVVGVINLRGKVIPVYDLRERFGLEDFPAPRQPRIMVLSISKRLVGIKVDAASEVLTLSQEEIEPPPEELGGIEEGIAGIAKVNNRLIILLDLGKILTSPLMEGVS
jgi:purine-binding chemotaxis protein CheW